MTTAPTAASGSTREAVDPAAFCTMSGGELDALFRRSPAGAVPDGPAEGLFRVLPGTPASRPAARLFLLFAWQGKRFDARTGVLVNHVLPFGVPAVEARLRPGRSWLDGRPCHVLDYSRTSLIARGVRDELREVAPGLYLGLVYWHRLRAGRFALRVRR